MVAGAIIGSVIAGPIGTVAGAIAGAAVKRSPTTYRKATPPTARRPKKKPATMKRIRPVAISPSPPFLP